MINRSFKLSILAAVMLPLTTHSVWALSTEERLQRLEQMANNPVLLQLSQRVAEQQREIQALQDEMDRVSRANRFGIQQGTKRYSETDQRISDLEKQVKALSQSPSSRAIAPLPVPAAPVLPSNPAEKVAQEAGGVTPELGQASSSTLKTYPATAEENAEYQTAFALMRASKYKESITAFEAFLAKSPKSSLASNASYWAGEGYLIRKEYDKALSAFNLVVERYPDSSKVPDALLRAADSLMSLKKTADARVLYQKVMDGYPETRAAKSAKKRIK